MYTVVLSAGHIPGKEPGACSGKLKEAEVLLEYRDELRRALADAPLGYRVVSVSDAYSLRETIKFSKTFKNDLCIELHFNACDNPDANGMEVFYQTGNKKCRKIANKLCAEVSEAFGLTNRGAKLESASSIGRLGFIHELENSLLIEIAFLSCPEDMKKVKDASRWANVVANCIDVGLREWKY